MNIDELISSLKTYIDEAKKPVQTGEKSFKKLLDYFDKRAKHGE